MHARLELALEERVGLRRRRESQPHLAVLVASRGEAVESVARHPRLAGVALGVEAVGQVHGGADDGEHRVVACVQLHVVTDADATVCGKASVEHDLIAVRDPPSCPQDRPTDRDLVVVERRDRHRGAACALRQVGVCRPERSGTRLDFRICREMPERRWVAVHNQVRDVGFGGDAVEKGSALTSDEQTSGDPHGGQRENGERGEDSRPSPPSQARQSHGGHGAVHGTSASSRTTRPSSR